MKKLIYMIICFSTMLFACEESEDTSPSNAEYNRLEDLVDLSFPLIKEYHDKYESYILYEFDFISDFAYMFAQASSWRNAAVEKLDIKDVPKALEYLEQHFFPYYVDTVRNGDGKLVQTDFHKKHMPLKLLICKEIVAGSLGISTVEGNSVIYHDATASMNSFTIARLDSVSLKEMSQSADRPLQFRNAIHYMFIAGYLNNAKGVEVGNDNFYEISRVYYDTEAPATYNPTDFYTRGFIPPTGTATTSVYPSKETDLRNYIHELINLTSARRATLRNYPVVKSKSVHLARSLAAMGIDIFRLNPEINELIK